MLTLMNGGWGISYEIVLRWMPLDFTDDKSTLVQVMSWCRQATSHYMSQCWPRSMSPSGIIRPQWVNKTDDKQSSGNGLLPAGNKSFLELMFQTPQFHDDLKLRLSYHIAQNRISNNKAMQNDAYSDQICGSLSKLCCIFELSVCHLHGLTIVLSPNGISFTWAWQIFQRIHTLFSARYAPWLLPVPQGNPDIVLNESFVLGPCA